MRHVVISILFMAMPGATSAQTANDRDVVLQTVQTFFNTMTTNDAEGAGKILMPLGRFHIMDMRKSTLEPRTFTGEEYLARMRESKQTRRERIWDPRCACTASSPACGRRTTSGWMGSSVTAA